MKLPFGNLYLAASQFFYSGTKPPLPLPSELNKNLLASHHVSWDYNTKRPIVGGQIEDPKTGEVRAAGSLSYAGPPAIRFLLNDVTCLDGGNLISGTLFYDSLDSAILALSDACMKFPLQVVDITASDFFIHFSYSQDRCIKIGDVWEAIAWKDEDFTKTYEAPTRSQGPTSNALGVEINWLNLYGENFFKVKHVVHVSSMNDIIFGLARLIQDLGQPLEDSLSHIHSIGLLNGRLSVVCGMNMTADELRARVDSW